MLTHIDFEPPGFAEFAAGPKVQLAYPRAVRATVPGPAAYWRLHSSADDELGQNPGGFVGDPSLDQAGPIAWSRSRSIRFDGREDGFVAPLPTGFDPLSAWTLAAWIRLEAPTDPGRLGLFGFHRADAADRLYLGSGGAVGGELAILQEGEIHRGTADALPAGRWISLAMSWDGARLRCFRTGRSVHEIRLLGSISLARLDRVSASNLTPAQAGADDRRFAGRLAELALWPAALPASALRSLYTLGAGR